MTEAESSTDLQSNLFKETFENYTSESSSFIERNLSETSQSERLSDVNNREDSTDLLAAAESFQAIKNSEGRMSSETENTSSVEDIDLTREDANNKSSEDEWLDIIGNGTFKKKIIKKGLGPDTYPQRGDMVTVNVSFYYNDNLFEEQQKMKYIIGDLDVIQGLDLVICLMEKEEKAKVIIPSKLAYGKIGRMPEVPPYADIECDIELLDFETPDIDSLSVENRLQLGDEKRIRGNHFYERGDFIEAIHCYERAAEFLDGIRDCSGTSTEKSQEIVDMRIKVYNNMAASHLKLNAYSSALKSVELVLKIQPKNVKALFRKAKILGAEGSTEEAITCMKIAASLEPETKIIQAELIRLQNKKKKEEQSQRAMYQRMFPQSAPKQSSSFPKLLKWSAVTGGLLAVAVGMAAYRQYNH